MNNTSVDQSNEVSPLLGPWFLYPVATSYILIAAVAVIGNLLVCFAILANKSLRSKPTNLFLLSLAMSDFLTSAIAMPFDIESLLLQGGWKHGAVMCLAFLTAYLITVPTSILTLLTISVDRYLNLRDPLRHFRRTQFMTKRKALILIVLIWLYCIIFAFLPILGWPFIKRSTKNELEQCLISYSVLYNILSNFLNFVLPLVTTCVFNNMMYCIACKHNDISLNRVKSSYSSKDDAKAYASNLKQPRQPSCLWQPFSYFSIVSILYGEKNWNPYPSKVFYVLLMFGYLNSALNPFLFAFRNRQFKATYARIFTLVKRRSSRVWPRSTPSLSTVSSDVPEADNKDVRLQAVRIKSTTPDLPRRNRTSAQ